MFPWLSLSLSLFTTKIITAHFLFILYLNLRFPGSLWGHPFLQMATVSSRYGSRMGQILPPHTHTLPPNDSLEQKSCGLHSSGTVPANRKQQGIISLCGKDSGKMLLMSSQEVACHTGPLLFWLPRVRDIAKQKWDQVQKAKRRCFHGEHPTSAGQFRNQGDVPEISTSLIQPGTLNWRFSG